MKTYFVDIGYPTFEATVRAENEEEALELALESAEDNFFGAYDWVDVDIKEDKVEDSITSKQHNKQRKQRKEK